MIIDKGLNKPRLKNRIEPKIENKQEKTFVCVLNG